MASAASFMPASISSAMTRPHASTDSRLLQNLIKCEKTYQTHLGAVVQSSGTAAAALKAWGTSEARDVAQTSSQLADLLHDVADAQSNYLEAIKGYREALKDVADREASIRTIVKDRDILVSRLIKASKKNGDVPHAQRELTACEEVLEEEERALVGVKRRTFKEALSMRMKLMGDAGNRMIECAKEAILLLDEFDQHAGDDRLSFGHHEAVDAFGQSYYIEGSHTIQDYHQQQQHHHQHHSDDPDQQHWGQESVADEHFYEADQDPSRYQGSVTPSQSASQNARGMSTTYGSTAHNNGYTRPHFADGNPREAEERADSDASSIADAARQDANTAVHYNRGPVNSQETKAQDLSTHDTNLTSSATEQTQTASVHPQPQMYSVTAPQLNYDGPQMTPIPQAPRMYQRGEVGSTDDVRNPERQSGWASSRPGGRHDDDDSTERGGGARQGGGRPKPQKRNSFFGKFKGLFKADLGDKESPSKSRHSRNESSDRTSSVSGWNTRTDNNISSGRKSTAKANGTYQAPLMKPLGDRGGDESDSEDEAHRTDLIRVVNPNVAGRKAASDVGGTLRRTPSDLSRITAGPMSLKQQREAELRALTDAESQARRAVIGAGIGRPAVQRTDTINSTASKPRKQKKKVGTRSIAGSEVGTAATRQAGTSSAADKHTSALGASNNNIAARGGGGNYIIHGDLSSGSRGLASLVLPSDSDKSDKPYPSIMPPTGLSRSNSTATAATGRAATISGGSTMTKKKKKRQSAVSDSIGTGLNAMSPKDGGKWSTNNWVQGPQSGIGSGGGLAAQAVAGAGVVPYTSASPEEIAQKYANNATHGAQIQRPSSAQSAAPLRSAMKGHKESALQQQQQQTADSPSAPLQPRVLSVIEAPTPQLKLEEAKANLGPSISAPQPVTAVPAKGVQQQESHRLDSIPQSDPAQSIPVIVREAEQSVEMEPMSSPKLEQDTTFDGSGRLGLSRQSSMADDIPQQARQSSGTHEGTVPRLDMATPEPFAFDVDSMQQRQQESSAQQSLIASAEDPALMTPGERFAYENLLGSDSMRTPSGTAAPALAGFGWSGYSKSPGVTKTTVDRQRVGGDTVSSSIEEEPLTTATTSLPDGVNRPGVNPLAGRSSMEEPSRTYSNDARSTPTVHSKATSENNTAPAPSNLSTSLQLPAAGRNSVNKSEGAPASIISDATVTGVNRRKSVRMAPDTKLPPDTPTQLDAPGMVSDGFGGFTVKGHSAASTASAASQPVLPMHLASAPGSAIISSGNVPIAPTSFDGPSVMASRMAPPVQAPPRLPTKDGSHSSERERSTWSTRTDRRLGNDDSSDEEGRGGSGEGEDAYASARRAMGAATKRWKATVSPAKKSSKSGGGGGGGSVKSGKKSKTNSSGYNAAIPLPRGMEVVGRQKASK